MPESHPPITAEDRVALLRHGIVVVEAETVQGTLRLAVTGVGHDRVCEAVVGRLGPDVEIDVLGRWPRRIQARRCVGHREREPGRLQLRFVLRGDEHVDDIVVAEDEQTVAVLGTVCTSVAGEEGDSCEVPCHVYLERPLGDRKVIDALRGEVPYKNVWAEIEARGR